MIYNNFARYIASRAGSGDFEALKYFPFLLSSRRLGVDEARGYFRLFLHNARERLRENRKRNLINQSRDCPYLHLIDEISRIFLELGAVNREGLNSMHVSYRGIEIRVF